MGARGRVREETRRGGRRGGRRGRGGRGGGGGGRKLDKLGLYPRARVSRFRRPPEGHPRGDRAAPHGSPHGSSPRFPGGSPHGPARHRGRGMAAPLSPPSAAGAGGRLKNEVRGQAPPLPPSPTRRLSRGPASPAALPRGPGASELPRAARSLPAPPPRPPLSCQPRAAQRAQPHCGPAQTAQHLPRGRGAWTRVCGRGAGAAGGRGARGAERPRAAGPGSRGGGPEGAARRLWRTRGRRGGGGGRSGLA